jgi:pimeloyl-ACP methyl ester carboxylesterase
MALALVSACVAAGGHMGLFSSQWLSSGWSAPRRFPRRERDPARPVVSPRFELGPCPTTPEPIAALKTARCGQLIVPENRSRPNGPTIRLSVAIVAARSGAPEPDPIVWLAGGPGDDSITEIPMALGGDLNQNRDVIFLSQRGTYTAQPPLACPVVDRFPGETLDLPYDAASTGRAFAAATRSCRRRLSGVDLSAYDTIESADDLEDLRGAVGIDRWNVYGISYGTDHALTYMNRHPEALRSVGIDGIFPPSLAGGVAAWTSAGEGINAVFRACAAQRRCRQRYGNIGATFRRLVRRFERFPRTVSVRAPGVGGRVRVTISGGMLVQYAASPGTHLAAKLPADIDALAHGRPKRVAVAWAGVRANPASVGILGQGLFYGVSCREWVPYETEAAVIRRGRRAFPTFPLSVLRNAPNLQFMRPNCRVWDVPRAPASIRAITRSTIPTLAMSAQYDAQTGASFGPYVARTLPNSTVVTIPNVAHVAFSSPSPAANACAHSIARSFFNDPADPDTSCIASVPPTRFEITPPFRGRRRPALCPPGRTSPGSSVARAAIGSF